MAVSHTGYYSITRGAHKTKLNTHKIIRTVKNKCAMIHNLFSKNKTFSIYLIF